MLTPSALQIVDQSPSKLVIVDPPNFTLGVLFVVLAVAMLGVAVFLFRYHDARRIGAYGECLIAVLFLLIAAWSSTAKTTITFSRERGLVQIQSESLGSPDPATEIPLQKIKRANVEALRSTRRLVLVLNDAEPVVLVSASSREGYYQAAEAINAFLGAPGDAGK